MVSHHPQHIPQRQLLLAPSIFPLLFIIIPGPGIVGPVEGGRRQLALRAGEAVLVAVEHAGEGDDQRQLLQLEQPALQPLEQPMPFIRIVLYDVKYLLYL